MCDKVILENGGRLKSVPGCYKNLKTRNKTVDKNLPPIGIGLKTYVIKLVLLYWILSLIDLKLNKYVIKLFLKNLFC